MVAVLLADGFEEIEAVTPIDFLRRAGIAVAVVGVGGVTIRGAHGIVLAADIAIADYEETPRYVVLPGGRPGADNLAASRRVRALLERAHRGGGTICAICAAPAIVLAPWGYLNGKQFTCYPDNAADAVNVANAADAASAPSVYREEAVVRDGRLITSRGAGTAARFSAEIIADIKGAETARQIMSATLQPDHRS